MSASVTEESAIADGIALDRSDWELVRFGDVALKQNESVDREATDLTRYVNGGHMGSEDLHLREWGELGDDYLGPAFTRKFCDGDILYGSRRTYLRKVAVAHFDGITANTTFVIKPNEELIFKELLPFVMLSEGFAQHSIRNSKGSVNPYINWKDIANYEFLLPPKDQQAKLAELLWAADTTLQSHSENHLKLLTLRDTSRKNLFSVGIASLQKGEQVVTKKCKSGLIRSDWDELRFSDAISITNGQVDPTDERYSGLVQIGPERIEKNTGRILEYKSAEELGISSGNYLFTKEDILYSKIRPYFKKVANPDFEGLCSADVYPLRVTNPRLLKDFVFYYLLTEQLTQTLLRFQNRTGMPKVNRDELMCMFIPVPELSEQEAICSTLSEIDGTIETLKNNLAASLQLLKSLINQIF